MTRTLAVARAAAYYDSGALLEDLRRRVAYRTESQNPARGGTLRDYLDHELTPTLEGLGFAVQQAPNPVAGQAPFLIARRIENPAFQTVLMYGHGDVVRGYEDQWSEGRDPWTVRVEGDRWYGRGTADNKGQHSVNLAALHCAIDARAGRLGFNVTWLLEMGEETGSPGLGAICAQMRELLAADLLIASDGPRLSAERPTVFLGSRGAANFKLSVTCREGGHHSGNWGGLLRNPAIVLANALACLVDARGVIAVEALRPTGIPAPVRRALADIHLAPEAGSPAIDADWGEPGLTPEERVFGWNALEVLAFKAGNPDHPVGAIPPSAFAHCQLRFVVGTEADRVGEAVRAHLDRHGFGQVEVEVEMTAPATRLSPDNPWVSWAVDSIARTTGKAVAVLPNLGGTLPNDVFADTLQLPTVWVPHSYPACAQHAPNEHLLGSVAREGLCLMTGLFWDLGEGTTAGVGHGAAAA